MCLIMASLKSLVSPCYRSLLVLSVFLFFNLSFFILTIFSDISLVFSSKFHLGPVSVPEFVACFWYSCLGVRFGHEVCE